MLSDEQLEALIGIKVKVKPNRVKGGKKKGGNTVALLKGLEGNRALIVPSKHKRIEKVPKECIVFFKKGLALNEEKFKQVISLFDNKPKQIEDSSMKKAEQQVANTYYIYCPNLGLYWGGKNVGFVYEKKAAQVYNNLVGPRVALKHIGKPKKIKGKIGEPKWQHILKHGKFEVFSDEELKIAGCGCDVCFTSRQLQDPEWKEEKETKLIEQDIDRVVQRAEAIEEITIPTPESKPKLIEKKSERDEEEELLEKYSKARIQVYEAEKLLSESQQELRKIEAEIDIFRMRGFCSRAISSGVRAEVS